MIKKFKQMNESMGIFSDRKIFPLKQMDLLNAIDFAKIHKDDRKVFYLSVDIYFKEAKSISEVRKANINQDFPYLLFTTDEKINKVDGLIKNIFELKKAHETKIELLYKQLAAYIQK